MERRSLALSAICVAWAVAQPIAAIAASGVIELEIPGMNPVTAAAISDFTTNPCPATVEAIRTSVATNYDGVVARKAEKRDELQAETNGLAAELAEMIATNAAYARFDPDHAFPAGEEGHPVVNVSYDDAVAYCEWLSDNSPGYAYKYRLPTQEEWELAAGHMPKDASINAAGVESGTTDVYFYYGIYTNGAQSLSGCLDMWGNAWEWLATPDANGMMKIKGGAWDEPRSQCRTEERGNARDPSQGYPNVGFRILRTRNWAAAVIADSNSFNWIRRHMGKSLAAADYRELEADPDGDGFPTWAEYIALTDPNIAASRFMATMAMAPDGTPVIGCSDGSGGKTYALPRYSTVYGKVSLSDSVWLEVRNNPELYRFFKVTVDMK